MFSYIRGMHGVVSLGGICIPLYIYMHPCIYIPPYICKPLVHLYAPIPPAICSPYTICSPYVKGALGYLYAPSYALGSFEGHHYICQAFVPVSTYAASQFIKKSCQLLPIIVGCVFTGQDVFGCLLCFMLLLLSL